jgi:16S rRNA (guanine1516-N2)-methyltransferase
MKLVIVNKEYSSKTIAESLAKRLGLQVITSASQLPPDSSFVLWTGPHGLALAPANNKLAAATSVDFTDPTLQYRLRTSGKRQGIGKAVGLDKASGIVVLDATAGLGKDALVLAYLGCNVLMLEKSPVIHALLEDGLQRALASQDELLGATPQRMQLFHGDARQWFADIAQGTRPKPDVIYLDPMFPARSKTASVKKDIALLQSILEVEDDFPGLLEAARNSAQYRVVVKRPGNKPGKDVPAPTFIVPGKAAHFEVYVNKSFSSIR